MTKQQICYQIRTIRTYLWLARTTDNRVYLSKAKQLALILRYEMLLSKEVKTLEYKMVA